VTRAWSVAAVVVAAWLCVSGAGAARAQVRPSGAADAVFLAGEGVVGGALTVDLWAPVGALLRIGGVLGVGGLTSDDDARSRIFMPAGASVSLVIGAERRPFFELRVRGGLWGGATNQGLAASGWLAGGAYFGYALGPNVAIGAGVSAWWLAGHGGILAVAPGITASWQPLED